MNILMLGGTRFFGKHTVKKLLAAGHHVTIATRGTAQDAFGDSVERIIVDRTDAPAMKKALTGREFDVVYDTLAYSSEDIRCLFSAMTPKRYVVVSTMSVYEKLGVNTKEEDYKGADYPLVWCGRQDAPYDETKRQMEAALYQVYREVDFAAVRFPFVIGKDDYTKRLHFYVEHTVKEIPMSVDNSDAQMSFIFAEDAADFLVWLADAPFGGSVNAANAGTVSMGQVIDYVEKQTGKKAVISEEAARASYNGTPQYSLNTELAEKAGYEFPPLAAKLCELLDELIMMYRVPETADGV